MLPERPEYDDLYREINGGYEMTRRFVRVDEQDWKRITLPDIDYIMLKKDHHRMLIFLVDGDIVDVHVRELHQYHGRHLSDMDIGIEP